MAEQTPDSLVVWGLSTFHTAFLVAVLITLIHSYGSLNDLLRSLNTTVGLVLYLVLWGTTWWTTHNACTRASPDERANRVGVLKQGLLWGAINGVCFLVGIVLIALAPQFVFQGVLVADLLSLVFIIAIGSVFAFVIGAIVGGLFALLDIVLFRVAAS